MFLILAVGDHDADLMQACGPGQHQRMLGIAQRPGIHLTVEHLCRCLDALSVRLIDVELAAGVLTVRSRTSPVDVAPSSRRARPRVGRSRGPACAECRATRTPSRHGHASGEDRTALLGQAFEIQRGEFAGIDQGIAQTHQGGRRNSILAPALGVEHGGDGADAPQLPTAFYNARRKSSRTGLTSGRRSTRRVASPWR